MYFWYRAILSGTIWEVGKKFIKYDKKDENGNAASGETILHDTKNSYVYAPNSLVAVVGMDDVIVVQEGDTILVCKRDRAEDIKAVVEEIKKRKLDQYL